MSDFPSTLGTINQQAAAAIPTVIAAVQAVEALAPEGTTGAQKAAAALNAATATLAAHGNPNVAGLATLINMSVLVANLLGVFRKKQGSGKL